MIIIIIHHRAPGIPVIHHHNKSLATPRTRDHQTCTSAYPRHVQVSNTYAVGVLVPRHACKPHTKRPCRMHARHCVCIRKRVQRKRGCMRISGNHEGGLLQRQAVREWKAQLTPDASLPPALHASLAFPRMLSVFQTSIGQPNAKRLPARAFSA